MLFRRLPQNARLLLVQWSEPRCRYLLVQREPVQPRHVVSGSFDHEESLDQLVARLKQEILLTGEKICPIALVLSRGEVETQMLRLPPATDQELPDLVRNTIARNAEDPTKPPVADFLAQPIHAEKPDGRNVFSVAWGRAELESWQARFQNEKLELAHVTFGPLGALQLLRQTSRPQGTSVVVTTTDQDIDLVVATDGTPTMFRTFPRASDNELAVAEQLTAEIRRTLTLADDETTRIYLIGPEEDQKLAASILKEQLHVSVKVLDPFDQLSGGLDTGNVERSRFANLIGIACAWNQGGIDVDLLHPRSGPLPPNHWRRAALWGSLALLVGVLGGFVVWDDRATRAEEIFDLNQKLSTATKEMNRALEKQDVVNLVTQWRQGEVNWLNELQALSERLPPSEQMLMKSLNLSVNSANQGIIHFTVQVQQAPVKAEIDRALRENERSVTIKQVAETSGSSDLPWRFDAQVSFAPAPPVPLPQPESKP